MHRLALAAENYFREADLKMPVRRLPLPAG